MDKNNVTTLESIRFCDLCGEIALYDAKIPMGSWAYLCATHFHTFKCRLGMGKGQKLVYL